MDADLTDCLKWYLVFLTSTVCHEAAHAWAAQKLGDNTAALGGQVSLDPTPHIRREPLGMVVVPIVSFLMGGWMIGWASAPYSREWAFYYPRRSAAMALAGPAVNLALALVAVLLMHLGMAAHFFLPPSNLSFTHLVDSAGSDFSYFAAQMVSILFSLNLLLATFNLLPVPPLDGSNAPGLFLPANAARRWMEFTRQPQVRMLGLFLAWRLFGTIFPEIHKAATHFLFPQTF